jgi:molybdenum cofactor cytidylyltransferase
VITGIILAAGTSSRLGRPKQLLDLGGVPVIQHVLDASTASTLDDVILVLGHGAQEIADAVTVSTHRVRVVFNPDYSEGMSASLKAGLSAATPASRAVLVLLGDQPGVSREAIDAVTRSWREGNGPIVQASYGGRPGHPIVLDRSVWPDIQGLSGDEGARSILLRCPELRTLVEVGETPPHDIDTEEDYAHVRLAFERSNARNRQ